MADIEKVIEALEHCEFCACFNCPYNENGKGGWNCRQMHKDALELLEEYQKIVRCKDCKYCDTDTLEHCWCMILARSREPDWFCADGKRKEEE